MPYNNYDAVVFTLVTKLLPQNDFSGCLSRTSARVMCGVYTCMRRCALRVSVEKRIYLGEKVWYHALNVPA
jgi:hypothetical protein